MRASEAAAAAARGEEEEDNNTGALPLLPTPSPPRSLAAHSRALANGARQLVVQEALEMIGSECLYWSALTPTT